jgi:hypothetical protein
MCEDFAASYPGGTRKLELAKGHPDVKARVHGLFDELAVEHEMMLPLIERPPSTIQIGTFSEVKQLRQALVDGRFRISDYADDLLGQITLVSEPDTLELYRATNAELGLTQGGTVAQSFEAITKIGGEKLPAEAGPQYRLQNSDQPMGQWELIYMDPMPGRDGYLGVFSVGHGRDGRWLHGDCAYPEYFYGADSVWVFGRK